MATMPTRLASFRTMLDGILPQLDLLYVFLDGFDQVPDFLSGRPVVPELLPAGSRLHNGSRFLAPARHGGEAIFVFLDDDLAYPADYVDVLLAGLQRYGQKAVVGFHGSLFMPPHRSYLEHRRVFHFARALERDTTVHQLGAGTMAFHSSAIRLDPGAWAEPRMDDLCLAAEAASAGVELVALERRAKWLRPIAQNQPDSIWRSIRKDEGQATAMMREILVLYAAPGRAAQPPRP